MPRRDDVIAAAVAIIRERGPGTLTSGNVAARVGISQPAVYRHIRDMDELVTLASTVVVDDLIQVVVAAAAAPPAEWVQGTRVAEFGRRLAHLAVEHGHGFEIMARCRHDPGELGDGVRSVLSSAAVLVAGVLEEQWRLDLDDELPFDEPTAAVQLLHARLIVDDVVTYAHAGVGATPPVALTTVERMLSLRVFAGWCAYAVDLARRWGLPVPTFDGPCLRVPRLVDA
jgi:AcrR family transcriptional regulator